MSKAFTRESDDAPEIRTVPVGRPRLPPGTKNYLTEDGAKRFHDELTSLQNSPRTQNGASAQLVDEAAEHRMAHLEQALRMAVVVAPPGNVADATQIRFGAFVQVRDSAGCEFHYRIVGIDETELDEGWISWLSPVASALFRKKVGDKTHVQTPGGRVELTILAIKYLPPLVHS